MNKYKSRKHNNYILCLHHVVFVVRKNWIDFFLSWCLDLEDREGFWERQSSVLNWAFVDIFFLTNLMSLHTDVTDMRLDRSVKVFEAVWQHCISILVTRDCDCDRREEKMSSNLSRARRKSHHYLSTPIINQVSFQWSFIFLQSSLVLFLK